MRLKMFVCLFMIGIIMLSACSFGEDQSENSAQNNQMDEQQENSSSDDSEDNGLTEDNDEESSSDNNDSDESDSPQQDSPGEMEMGEMEMGEMEMGEMEYPDIPDFPDVDMPNVDVEGDEDEITMQVPDALLFGFDKSDLKPEAKQTLDEMVTVLEEYDGSDVEINGHTDSTGDEAYNMNLSEERADSVHEYLEDQGALEEVTAETEGYGETEPIASNDSEEGQQKNRRVEVIIDTDDE